GHAVHRREQRRNREPAGHGVAPQVDRLRKTVRAEHVGAYFIDPWPPSRSTEKSWPHFRPPPVDFCSSRLAIGAATERARRLAMPAGTRAKPYKRDSSGVAPASPQVAKSGAEAEQRSQRRAQGDGQRAHGAARQLIERILLGRRERQTRVVNRLGRAPSEAG